MNRTLRFVLSIAFIAASGAIVAARAAPWPWGGDYSLAGGWRNVNAAASDLTRLDITPGSGLFASYRAHAFGKCRPRDCDWGVEDLFGDPSEMRVMFLARGDDAQKSIIGYINLSLRPNASGGLDYLLITHFANPSTRPDLVYRGRLRRR